VPAKQAVSLDLDLQIDLRGMGEGIVDGTTVDDPPNCRETFRGKTLGQFQVNYDTLNSFGLIRQLVGQIKFDIA
jgi:hypothetical protein